MAVALKDTLNLPVTDFAMRANLTGREPERIKHREKIDLYGRIQKHNAGKPAFVLHDGPPFTNGDVHIGTALNKLLKDIVLRYKTMRGFRTPYVPGWDCHGLPIEHKVMKDLQAQKKDLNALDIRKACADFSLAYMEKQRNQFKRLGVLADWNAEYKTLAPAYEADILRTFAAFVEQDLVYRSKKPVYWSIPCATALAEAEIEYKDKKSPSIWVAFPVPSAEAAKIDAGDKENLSVVIWTTTPWTLPANLAIAVHPELGYVEVSHAGKTYLVAEVLSDAFIAACKLEGATKGKIHQGRALEGMQPRHPFIDRASPLVLAEYVTTDAGSGCVHTAPGHGLEDYQTGLKYGLEIYCPVNDAGIYADDGKVPAELVGISILETDGKCPANIAVLKMLEARGALLKLEFIQHQYPHCWRSKTPVVFRAMDQWFVGLDRAGKRQAALDEIGKVAWTPEWGENRIRGAVQSRPDWCISRQRSWGVPIPAFYDAEKNPYLDAGVIKAVAAKVEAAGTDLWFEKSAKKFSAASPCRPGGRTRTNFPKAPTRSTSGSIPAAATPPSSRAIPTSLGRPISTSKAPTNTAAGSNRRSGPASSPKAARPTNASSRTVLSLTKNAKKFPSPTANRKPPTATSTNTVPTSCASGSLRKIIKTTFRSPTRFSIRFRTNTARSATRSGINSATCSTSTPAKDAVPLDRLTLIDKWALHKLRALVADVTDAFEKYEFHKAYALLTSFTTTTLSATYHNILKDRLYTLAPNAPERRSSQTAIRIILETLIKLFAPFIAFTADEAWSFFTAGTEYSENSVHLENWPVADDAWKNDEAAEEFDALLAVLDKVNIGLEVLRQNKTIGQSLDARVIIHGDPAREDYAMLCKHEDILSETFIVSEVNLVPDAGIDTRIETEKAAGVRCPRSWRWVPRLVSAGEYGEVSPRCRAALAAKYNVSFS